MGGFEDADLESLLNPIDQNYIGWANYLSPLISAYGETAAVTMTVELSDSFCSTDPQVAKVIARSTFFSDNRDDLPQVTAPCRILQNRTDAIAPLSLGEYMHTHLAGSRLQVVAVQGQCAHMNE